MSATPLGVHLSPAVRVDSTLLAERGLWTLTEVRTVRAVRTVGRCTVRYSDPEYALAESNQLGIGKKLSVTAQSNTRGSSSRVVFSGEITGIAMQHGQSGRPELVVTAEDAAHRLARSSRALTYLDMTYEEIIKQRLESSAVGVGSLGSSGLRPYVLQADTDLAFINDLTARLGKDWIVTDGDLDIWDPTGQRTGWTTPVDLTLGEDISEFSTQLTSAAPSEVTVRGIDPTTSQLVRGHEVRPASTEKLATTFKLTGAARGTVLDTTSNPLTGVEATELATAGLRSQGNVVARGRLSVRPELEPGGWFVMHDAGPGSGRYYVREVVHLYSTHRFVTEVVAGDRPDATLRSALGAHHGSPTSSFTHHGMVVGKVSDVDDTGNLGRVKVTFTVLSETITSDWARVAAIGGGANRGLLALPEIGDEVLLGFEGADVRRPVVLAGLYGAENAPPGAVTAQKDGKVLTRALTSRLGHVVELSDGSSAAAQHVLVALAGLEHKLKLGKDSAELSVPDNVPLTISAGSSTITLDGTGKITVTGTEISFAADMKIVLKAPTIDISATSKASVTGAQVEVKGSATTAVESSGMMTIKGAMVNIN